MSNHVDEIYLVEHDDFVMARLDFNIIPRKVFFAISHILNVHKVEPKLVTDGEATVGYKYSVDLKEVSKLVQIKYDWYNDRRLVTNLLKEFSKKQIIFNDETLTMTEIENDIIKREKFGYRQIIKSETVTRQTRDNDWNRLCSQTLRKKQKAVET